MDLEKYLVTSALVALGDLYLARARREGWSAPRYDAVVHRRGHRVAGGQS